MLLAYEILFLTKHNQRLNLNCFFFCNITQLFGIVQNVSGDKALLSNATCLKYILLFGMDKFITVYG